MRRRTYADKVVSGKYQTAVSNKGIIYRSKDFGVTWEEITIIGAYFKAVAMSADGKYQTAVGGNTVYRSQDHGVTWTKMTDSAFDGLMLVDMSADGKYQVTGSFDIFYSSDYGMTWSLRSKTQSWSILMSADGKFCVLISHRYIFHSEDYGLTFKYLAYPSAWGSATSGNMSADGRYQTVLFKNGVAISQDYGVTFSGLIDPGGYTYEKIAMCSNGRYQTIAAGYAWLYRSEDYGHTWTNIVLNAKKPTSNTAAQMISIDISADGKYQTALSEELGSIFRSEDYGVTWQKIITPNTGNWTWVTINK